MLTKYAPKNGAKTHKKISTKKRPKQAVKVSLCLGYIRVSSDEQADSGLSLDNQRARIQAQCAANGWELLEVFEDAGVSAKNLERPALRRALRAMQPGRVLLALKLDRFTRSVPDLYTLDALVADTGGEWATIAEHIDTSTATGRMMRTFIATIAEWERGIIAERTAAALGQKKARKERLGTTPLGYKTIEGADGVKMLVEDEDEMKTVNLVRELHEGGLSLRRIAAHLTANGHKTKRGGAWEAATVARLLATRYIETLAG
jgi:DNA invertase Pin-like site-specific DNA recombinase